VVRRHPPLPAAAAEALVERGPGLDVLPPRLPVGTPVSHLHLLRLDHAPEPALILDDVSLTDFVAVDLHGTNDLAGRAGKSGAEANSLIPPSLWLPPQIPGVFGIDMPARTRPRRPAASGNSLARRRVQP